MKDAKSQILELVEREYGSGKVQAVSDLLDNENFDMYKSFYDENRIALLQYENLRENFKKMTSEILGDDYYNYGHDVYSSDIFTCESIVKSANKVTIEKIKKIFLP